MKNITNTEIATIRNIKIVINKMEKSLEKYMDMDLSDAGVRSEIRNITAHINHQENALTAAVNCAGS